MDVIIGIRHNLKVTLIVENDDVFLYHMNGLLKLKRTKDLNRFVAQNNEKYLVIVITPRKQILLIINDRTNRPFAHLPKYYTRMYRFSEEKYFLQISLDKFNSEVLCSMQ